MQGIKTNHATFNWVRILSAALLASVTITTNAAAASNFECPPRPTENLKIGVVELKALLPVGDPLDNPGKLNAAIDVLRGQGLSTGSIVDTLIGTYCPVVAEDNQLNAAQKASRVQRFAAQVTRIVYSMQGADEIILDVPFKPVTVDAINARANAAKLPPDAWIAQTVDKALMAQQ